MQVLRYGAELRSYGTHDTVEEVTGRFSEFRGGCQQALLAIEFLPTQILDRLKIGWKGFVVTGHHKFLHVNEVINVPTDALWNPQTWWALYHEIAHIVVENLGDFIDFPSIQQFLANKDNHDSWIRLVNEMAAEVIGFELGFFNDYALFLKLLWNHLVKVDPFQREHIDIRGYFVRSFFPKIFKEHFKRVSKDKHVSKEQFNNLDFLFRELVSHMELIERSVGRTLFEHKHFLAAQNAPIFRELYPFACELYKKIANANLSPNMKARNYRNTREVFDSLKRGRIWLKRISCPEAVLYHLIQIPNPSFSTRVATILTFWNQQRNRINR